MCVHVHFLCIHSRVKTSRETSAGSMVAVIVTNPQASVTAAGKSTRHLQDWSLWSTRSRQINIHRDIWTNAHQTRKEIGSLGKIMLITVTIIPHCIKQNFGNFLTNFTFDRSKLLYTLWNLMIKYKVLYNFLYIVNNLKETVVKRLDDT